MTNVPTTPGATAGSYRALVCERLSNDLSGLALHTRTSLPPGRGQVAIRMRAAALNFPDLLMSRGGYQQKPTLPFVAGLEGAGEVVELGEDVQGWRIGQRVSPMDAGGTISERVIASADKLIAVPEGFDYAQAAAFRVGAITAWVGLARRGQLRAGETVLVHGATGGMGVAAVQLARHLGATVIATGTSDDKLRRIAPDGAHHLVNLRGGFRERVLELTEGRGADLIFDPVGGDVFDESLRAIAWGGRLLVIGFASGRIPTLPVNLALIKQISVIGVRAGEAGRRDPVQGAQDREQVERLAAQGVFRPLIGARYRLDDALEALRALDRREVAGKIVIEM